MKQITNRAADLMKGNNLVIGRLMVHFNKSQLTINRMIDSRDVKLTLAGPMAIIREETGLSDEEILEEVATAAA